MPPFRDEHILIIAPGSRITLAQLGLPESFTQASHRFPTRMFLSQDGKTYEPYKIKSRKKEVKANGVVDVEMGGTGEAKEDDDDDEELIELPEDDEDAIYPLTGMRMARKPLK
jgi:actin-related protein 9